MNSIEVATASWADDDDLRRIGSRRTGTEDDRRIDELVIETIEHSCPTETAEVPKAACDLRAAFNLIDAAAGRAPRHVKHETAATAVLAAAVRPEHFRGARPERAAAEVIRFAAERIGREYNADAARFIAETVISWTAEHGLLDWRPPDEAATAGPEEPGREFRPMMTNAVHGV